MCKAAGIEEEEEEEALLRARVPKALNIIKKVVVKSGGKFSFGSRC